MPAVLVGFLIDCLLGDPVGLPHPIVLIGKGIAALERALADGWVAPACEWPRIRRETELAAQAIYKNAGKSR